MKVIHCLNHFLPGQVAGTEIYTLSLINALQQKNINALVLIPNYGKKENAEYEFRGIRVIQYAEPSVVDRSLRMGKRNPDGLPAFIETLKKENPDIVHFHDIAGSNGITVHHVKEAKLAGFKNVMTFHIARYSCKTGNLMYKDKVYCDGTIEINKCTKCNYAVNGLGDLKAKALFPIGNLFYSLGYDATSWNNKAGTAIGYPFIIKQLRANLFDLMEHADKLVVITKWYRDVLIRNKAPENKLVYIPQAVPRSYDDHFTPGKSVLPVKLIFIGRIIKAKGLHLLIEAIKNLSPEQVVLDIYGQDNNDEYAKKCKEDSLTLPCIQWKGLLEPADVHERLKDYDILCIPSVICEMSPLVIQEAFAAGIPVLASAVSGNEEQITNNVNGWIFKFNDADSLTGLIKKIIQNPSLVEEAKKNIPKVNVFKNVAEEYIRLYEAIQHELF